MVVSVQILRLRSELEVLVFEAQAPKAEQHGLHDAISPCTYKLVAALGWG